MMAAFVLWLGLFGLVLFVSFDAPMCRKNQKFWIFGSMVVAAMLTIPVLLILLAMQMELLR